MGRGCDVVLQWSWGVFTLSQVYTLTELRHHGCNILGVEKVSSIYVVLAYRHRIVSDSTLVRRRSIQLTRHEHYVRIRRHGDPMLQIWLCVAANLY